MKGSKWKAGTRERIHDRDHAELGDADVYDLSILRSTASVLNPRD